MSFLDDLENGPSAGKKILLIDANGGPETLGDFPTGIDNIGSSGPLNFAVFAQSNLNTGRPGGDRSNNPEVKQWDSSASEFSPWLLSNNNRWSHKLGRLLNRALRRPCYFVNATRSATALTHWVPTEDGGIGDLWDQFLLDVAAAGITKFDFFLLDQGEQGAGNDSDGNPFTYLDASRLIRDRLQSLGLIDDATVFLAREISSGATTSATQTAWVDERNNNGNIRPSEGLEYDDLLHISGAAHDVVAQSQMGFLMAESAGNSTGPVGPVNPTVYIARNPTTKNIVSNTTLALDADMNITGLPAGNYMVEGVVTHANGGGGIRVGVDGGISSLRVDFKNWAQDDTAPNITKTLFSPTATTSVLAGHPTINILHVTGFVTINSVGTFGLRFAQHTSNATRLKLDSGSYLKLTRTDSQ